MRSLLLRAAIFTSLSTFSQISLAEYSTLTLLDRTEPYPSMVSIPGQVWVGKSRKSFNADYSLEVYTSDGKILGSVRLPHSVSSLKAYTATSVILTGIDPNKNLTNFTIASWNGAKISAKTTEIALGGYANFWIGSVGGRNYFADMGGNPNDNGPIGQPAQTIFSSNGQTSRYLGTRLRMPVAGTSFENQLLMISETALGAAKTTVLKVDLATQKVTSLTPTPRLGINVLERIGGSDLFVANEQKANRIFVINARSGEVSREFPISGYVRSVAAIGHCVVAGNDESNTIEFFDLNEPNDKPTLALTVDLPANEFSGIRKIVVDGGTGSVFARSNYACNPIAETCDSDYNRIVFWNGKEAESVRKACL
ncbi:MAG: hypothetical protein NTV34_14670 [Proteobacteria bacterium]|nr:hypothetical protein [Pseudomonadota bacterium]